MKSLKPITTYLLLIGNSTDTHIKYLAHTLVYCVICIHKAHTIKIHSFVIQGAPTRGLPKRLFGISISGVIELSIPRTYRGACDYFVENVMLAVKNYIFSISHLAKGQ